MKRENRDYRIAIIVCWFGKFPWYFRYFLNSCSYNDTIDFLIFNDQSFETNKLPGNVRLISLSLDDLRIAASSRFKFSVSVDTPYKVCDYKPAYGYLFADFIEGYDFWGHSDIDLVFGDVRAFIRPDILDVYDIVSTRHDYITGSFCLYRNVDRINTLFKCSKDFIKVFSNPEHFCFDECSFLWEELKWGGDILEFTESIESMTHVVRKLQREGAVKAYFDFIIAEGTPGNIQFKNGKVTYNKEFEVLYYHLVLFKGVAHIPKYSKRIPKSYYFTKNELKHGEY